MGGTLDEVSATVGRGSVRELHSPGTPGYRRFNAAMTLAGLAAFGILYCTQALLPQLSDDFAVSPSGASLSVSAATGALALFVLPATSLGVRLGRIRTIRVGLLAAVLLTGLAAAAPSYDVLVAVRALAGVALAGVVAVAMGHVASEVHPRGLGAAMGLYVAGNSLGGISGRLVASAVVDVASWRWAVAVVAAAALVATAAFWVLVPPARGAPAAGSARDRGAAPLCALLRDPTVLALVGIPLVLMGGFVAAYNYLTYRLTEAPFELPAAVVGLVFLAYLAGTLSAAVAGRLADRFGRPRMLGASVVVMAAGLALTLPDRLAPVVAGLLVFTAGFFAAHAVASGWAPVVGAAHPTQASALYVGAYYAGSSVFGVLVGYAWHDGGWPATAAAVGALTLVGLGLGLVVAARSRAPRPGPRPGPQPTNATAASARNAHPEAR